MASRPSRRSPAGSSTASKVTTGLYPWLYDFERQPLYDGTGGAIRERVERTDESIRTWATTLIEKHFSYRVKGWIRAADANEWRPDMVALHHTLTITYGKGDDSYLTHPFGTDRRGALHTIGLLRYKNETIRLNMPTTKASTYSLVTCIPVRKVTSINHHVTEVAIDTEGVTA